MPELGVIVAVLQDEMVLLTQREDFAVWCLPGGAVDPDEPPHVAAVREVREETGLHVQLTGLIAVISRPYLGEEGRITFVFAAVPNGGQLRPDPREVLDLAFFAADRLPEPLMDEHSVMIDQAFSGRMGQVWLSTQRSLTQFPDRAALYRWRDESQLSRPEAYAALIRMRGVVEFCCVVGAPGEVPSTEGAVA